MRKIERFDRQAALRDPWNTRDQLVQSISDIADKIENEVYISEDLMAADSSYTRDRILGVLEKLQDSADSFVINIEKILKERN